MKELFIYSRLVLAFLFIFAILSIDKYAIIIILSILVILALINPIWSIKSVSLAVVIKFLNPAIYTYSFEASILGWLVIISLILRAIPLALSGKKHKSTIPILIFFILVLFLSLAVSNNVSISILKLIMFTTVTLSIVTISANMDINQIKELKNWFFSIGIAVILSSLPLYSFPAIGFLRNESGFQGIMNHPQAFGTFMSHYLSVCFIYYAFSKRSSIVYLLASVVLSGLIMLTETRTAALAVCLTTIFVYLILILGTNKIHGLSIGRSTIVSITCLFIFTIFFLFSESFINLSNEFIYKRDASSIEGALQSRSGGIELQWENFKEKPFTGHGFGVYPSGIIPEGVVMFMGLPISAPVEKGFVPTAILEETGIFGGAIFLWIIISLSSTALKTNDPTLIGLFFSCLFVNFGEAVIFSMGGIGLFFWLLISICITGENINLRQNHIKSIKKSYVQG